MIENIIHYDTKLFSFLNGIHSPVFDTIMYWYTQIPIWFPLYLFIIVLLIYRHRKKAIIPLILVALAVTATDQSCNFLKKETARFRPSHTETLADTIHLTQKPDGTYYTGGKYSFPSGHAANSMLFAFFIAFFIAEKKRWILYTFFGWALLMGYSRIYVGVHYPGDVICGFILGSLYGLLFFKYLYQWCQRLFPSLT